MNDPDKKIICIGILCLIQKKQKSSNGFHEGFKSEDKIFKIANQNEMGLDLILLDFI
jgi:hypothetical protein